MEFNSNNIRNIALVGHGKSGKTSIVENCLFKCGKTTRIGKTDEGTSVMDYTPEEIKRQMTVESTLGSCVWQNYKINFLDAPGYPDFTGEVKSVINACESALVVVSANSGIEIETDRAWQYLEEFNKPRAFFVNKMDRDNADFYKVVEELRAHFGNNVVPIQIPIGQGANFHGVVDLISMKTKLKLKDVESTHETPEYMLEEVDKARHMLMEVCAEFNDELLEKYLAEEEITEIEVAAALIEGIVNAKIYPVLCGSAYLSVGFRQLMNSIVEYMPTPYFNELLGTDFNTGDFVERNVDGDFSGQIFKTIVDPFIGRVSYLKILSGTLAENMMVYNTNREKTERIGTIYTASGKNQEAISIAHAGDIVIIPKLQSSKTWDTLCDEKSPIRYDIITNPRSMFTMAIITNNKSDEDKIGNALSRLLDEDITLSLEKNNETGDLLLSGVGEVHLDIALEKLKNKFGVNATFVKPKVPYRETIRGSVKVQGKHKKQSGGHGQFGDVYLEITPGNVGSGIYFSESIVGGAVPKQYFPAVEKGIHDTLKEGILAGFPVIDIRINLYDGSYHTVDSSEMAFKMAAAIAIKKGLPDAKPVLLEPYYNVTIEIPEYYMGEVIGSINTKRGRIITTESPAHNKMVIKAQIPEAELYKYATELRSTTQGRGAYDMEFSHYEEVPERIAKEIVLENTNNS